MQRSVGSVNDFIFLASAYKVSSCLLI